MPVNENITLPTEPVLILPREPGEVGYTRAMLEFLENSGLIEGRYELVEGRIYSKMGQNLPHSLTIIRLIQYLTGIPVFAGERIATDTSLEISGVSNRPAPDVIVLRERMLTGSPAGTDILLAVEVSDTTQGRDFGAKVTLYAQAGIAEYWVLDLPRRALTAHRTPDAEAGTWATVTTLAETQTIAPESAPDKPVTIRELLPPVA